LITRLVRPLLVALLVAPMVAIPTALAGTHSGEVTFRLTLEGDVNPADGFFLDVRCDGGDFCHGMDEQRTVYLCADEVIVDTVRCEAKSFEFTVEIPTQAIEYYLYQAPNVAASEERVLVLSGSWDVRGGSQLISLGYVYPGGTAPTPAPILPDTAMPVGG